MQATPLLRCVNPLRASALSEDLAFDPATAQNERVPGTARKGLGAEVSAKVRDVFLLSSSATYTHASFTATGDGYGEGDRLPYVPELVLRTDASGKKKVGRLFGRDLEAPIGAGLEGLVGRPLLFGDTGQNVFLVDASAGLRCKEVELGLDVFNVLDARWYAGTTASSSVRRTSRDRRRRRACRSGT